jgi:hypothetical protein
MMVVKVVSRGKLHSRGEYTVACAIGQEKVMADGQSSQLTSACAE